MSATIADYFDWKPTKRGDGAWSDHEHEDQYVEAEVFHHSIKVEVGSATFVCDNHSGIEGGKRGAELALEMILEWDRRMSEVEYG